MYRTRPADVVRNSYLCDMHTWLGDAPGPDCRAEVLECDGTVPRTKEEVDEHFKRDR